MFLTLVVEAVDPVDAGAFVVAPEEEEVLGVFDFVSEQEADSLEGLLASVNIITKEEVVGIRGEASVFEESEKIVVLSVNVTYKNEKNRVTYRIF